MNRSLIHQPVLVDEVLSCLQLRPGLRVLDGTVGLGGHAAHITEAIFPGGFYLGLDQDAEALVQARQRLTPGGSGVVLVQANFREAKTVMQQQGITHVDRVLLDLGVSSWQLDQPERGFSWRYEAALDMRMNQEQETTAADLLRDLSEKELEKLLREYGEERRSRAVARAIVHRRRRQPLETTTQLAGLVRSVVRRSGRIDPATRTFQALRLAVNQELLSLESFLQDLPDLLAPEGRAVLISFHSLEDRRIKQAFRRGKQEGEYRLLTTKPLTAQREEMRSNPRARSAKLRAVEKVGGDNS